jgi:pimeloyl-ACP methyl ester carboxylesterase
VGLHAPGVVPRDRAVGRADRDVLQPLRADPWPALALELVSGINASVYGHMWGSSEWHVTGTLADFDVRPVLPGLTLPVLFTCGEHDEARPDTAQAAQAALAPDARVHVFAGASHLTQLVPDEYRRVLSEFVSAYEA